MKPSIDDLEIRDLRDVAESIALEEGVTLERMFGTGRCEEELIARRRFYLHLQDHGWPLAAISRFVGRDRTTIRWALGRRKAA